LDDGSSLLSAVYRSAEDPEMTRRNVIVGLLVAALPAARPVWAVVNNGFETDYVYVIPGDGSVQVAAESDGSSVGTLLGPEMWETLTFSGMGTNDARLFVASEGISDIIIEEVNSAGSQVKRVSLKTLAPVGSIADLGNIRWSRYYPTSLFVSAVSNASGSTKGMIWEMDLGLSVVKKTYTGPVHAYSGDQTVSIAINDNDGTIYMVGYFLNDPAGTGKGDLIAFTSTTTWNVLIDASTFGWSFPLPVVWRAHNPTDATPTIWVGNNSGPGALPFREFYLDTALHPVDSNGNLQLRGSQISMARAWNGQQDEVTGTSWIAAWNGGFHAIRADDTTSSYYTGQAFSDIDSPAYSGALPPVIDGAPLDPDDAAIDAEYVRQLSLLQGTQPVAWSLEEAPVGAQIDQTGRISGWTPTLADFGASITFTVKAANTVGSDTATWKVEPAIANNSFLTNRVYAVNDPGDLGLLAMFRESDGQYMGNLLPPGSNWWSLTFAASGNNDARLFVARPNTPLSLGTDIEIAEVNSAGQTVRSVMLSTLIKAPVGTAIDVGGIRYSSLHNTLFVAANPDGDEAGHWTPATAWEIDLGLSTLIHTYIGANVSGYGVYIDIDPAGNLYMTSPAMGGTEWRGDLIKFNTAGRVPGGTTTSYTTLIDGPTYSAGDNQWDGPTGPIYRGTNNPDHRPTIVILMGAGGSQPAPALEFYLDQVDGNGNLVLRGASISTSRGWTGQLDDFTKQIWIGGLRGAVAGLWPDDTNTYWEGGRSWDDADSPPFRLCHDPVFDVDADGDVDQADFAVFQSCYTGSGFSDGLSLTCRCLDVGDDNYDGWPDSDGDIDSFDLAAFEACASGPGIAADPACDP
jgi:hypothetical protein